MFFDSIPPVGGGGFGFSEVDPYDQPLTPEQWHDVLYNVYVFSWSDTYKHLARENPKLPDLIGGLVGVLDPNHWGADGSNTWNQFKNSINAVWDQSWNIGAINMYKGCGIPVDLLPSGCTEITDLPQPSVDLREPRDPSAWEPLKNGSLSGPLNDNPAARSLLDVLKSIGYKYYTLGTPALSGVHPVYFSWNDLADEIKRSWDHSWDPIASAVFSAMGIPQEVLPPDVPTPPI
jgi:hypothetical protein